MRTYDDVHELIKRLRNNKVTLGHGEYGVDPLCELAAKELDKAANEIERLRAALERIRDVKPSWGAESEEMYEIARAALEGK